MTTCCVWSDIQIVAYPWTAEYRRQKQEVFTASTDNSSPASTIESFSTYSSRARATQVYVILLCVFSLPFSCRALHLETDLTSLNPAWIVSLPARLLFPRLRIPLLKPRPIMLWLLECVGVDEAISLAFDFWTRSIAVLSASITS